MIPLDKSHPQEPNLESRPHCGKMRVVSATRWNLRVSASPDEKVRVSPYSGGLGSHSLIQQHTDNHMINGTKLLNVAGMTRGRRDGILKSEKIRHVVKIGPMHLKGVWYEVSLNPTWLGYSD